MNVEKPWYVVTKNARYFSTFEADDDADATRKMAELQAAWSDPSVRFAWEPFETAPVPVPTGDIRRLIAHK
jgi:hypothetical protein